MTQPIKNARAEMALPKIFDIITKTLVAHKARSINYAYDANARVEALEFTIHINKREVPFRLPARVANVEKILYPNQQPNRLTKSQKEQAYRVAWANIRDWITAQCALIDTGMVKSEEVFLPYLIGNRGTTLYEELERSQFLLPAPGESEARNG